MVKLTAKTDTTSVDNHDQPIVAFWQRLALGTNNVVTPGNILSISGLVVVGWGVNRLYHGDWVLGLVLVGIGRSFDLADGFVAKRTHTATPLGELVDTTCDKLAVLLLLITGFRLGILSNILIIALLVYNVLTALVGMTGGRKHQLHPNRFGKLTMFTSWLLILAAIIQQQLARIDLTLLVTMLLLLYCTLGALSIIWYIGAWRQAVKGQPELAAWTASLGRIVFVYNRKASNYGRARQWIRSISQVVGIKYQAIDAITGQEKLVDLARAEASGSNAAILVAIAGGDGTVHSVVNSLVKALPAKPAGDWYVLPLWGGNANDFAYMLNGLSPTMTVSRLLTQSMPQEVPLIKLTIDKEVEYACCYASFGASAYAARQLDNNRSAMNTILRWLPPFLLLRELVAVMQALAEAPLHRAEIDDVERKLYEHSIINGSRIAKMNRIPIELTEPYFFHAIVERKGKSLIIAWLRILTGRPDTRFSKRRQLRFTTKNRLDAQIDGEVRQLPSGVTVKAAIVFSPLRFITVRKATSK
jgi:phosphatidylglycerophosphate synthase/diacylglycerol kinase family enzyme